MNCKICKSSASFFYKGQILNKYTVEYFKCTACGFIQTEKTYWLKEAYDSVIAQLDIGLIERNMQFAGLVEKLILTFFPKTSHYLDYGGGYGMFVRMMRDKGFSFYRSEPLCENIFAMYFDLQDSPVNKFDILTAFEVLEHLDEPLQEIKKMFDLGGTLFCSTTLAPANPEEFGAWWYRAPHSGQHIAFYTKDSLAFIAKTFDKKLYTNSNNFHVVTDSSINEKRFAEIFLPRPKESFFKELTNKITSSGEQLIRRKSLLQEDYKMVEEKILSRNFQKGNP